MSFVIPFGHELPSVGSVGCRAEELLMSAHLPIFRVNRQVSALKRQLRIPANIGCYTKKSTNMKQIIYTLTIYCLTINLGFSQQNQLRQNMKTALILIDIQNDYFDNGRMKLVGSDKASENARLLLERFRADSLPIIHIQHIATGPKATFFLPNTIGAEIHENVRSLGSSSTVN